MEVVSSHLALACATLFTSHLFSDATIKTGDDETPVHRCILSALSPVFHSMFSAGFKEQETATVEIMDMTTPSLRAFLRLLYTGRLVLQLPEVCDLGLSVFAACHKYCVPLTLTDAFATALSQSITHENCLSLLENAELYGERSLAARCRRFIAGKKLPPVGYQEIRLWYRRSNTKKVRVLDIVLPENSTVAELVTEVNKQLNRPRISLRILQVSENLVSRVLKKTDPLATITPDEGDDISLRAEEISYEEKMILKDKYLLRVHHFRTGNWSYEAFGEPFVMLVQPQDTLRKIKLKIRTKLGVSADVFHTWRFATFEVISGLRQYAVPTFVEDATRMSALLRSSLETEELMPLGIHHTSDLSSTK